MRVDRILAIVLIALSLLGAIGSWVVHPKSDHRLGDLAKIPAIGGAAGEIAVFNMSGPITDGDGDESFGSEGISASRLMPLLRQAEEDGAKAILLRINSPGGTAAASQAIFGELMRIRKAGKIKIVAAFGDVGASGGYYIAASAHHLMCLPSTTTGSIGVIAHVLNAQELLGKVGLRDQVFKSGKHKDIFSPTRAVMPDEANLIQRIVDDTYQQFLEAVMAGRPALKPAKLRELADGRIYTGRQALKVGLVDSLGNYEEALKKAADLAGIQGDPTTREYTEKTIFDYFFKLVARRDRGLHLQIGGRSLASRFPPRVPLALMD